MHNRVVQPVKTKYLTSAPQVRPSMNLFVSLNLLFETKRFKEEESIRLLTTELQGPTHQRKIKRNQEDQKSSPLTDTSRPS